jgi:soluble cytochrome b562
MESYVRALESFERETQEVYLDYMMGTFMATEGIGSSVATKVRQGWQWVKDMAHKVAHAVKVAAKAIGEAIQKFFRMLRRCPDEIETSRDQEMSQFMRGALALLDSDSSDSLTVEKLMERYTQVADELAQNTKDIPEGDLDAIDAATKDMQQLRSAYDERYKKLVPEKDNGEEEESSKKPRRKFNIKAFINRLFRNGKKADEKAKDAEKQIAKIETSIAKAADAATNASEEEGDSVEHQTKLQRALSKVLRFFIWVANFFKSIPSRIAGLFSKLMSFRSKAKVEDYDGPSPVIG